MPNKIVNLTPHPLVIEWNGGKQTIPSSGIARCETTETVVGDIYGIPVVRTEFGAVTGLPIAARSCPFCKKAVEFCDDCECGVKWVDCDSVYYIVSSITAQACRGRDDVFVPAHPIRDAEGRIIACAALGRI